ncbi:MAG: CPBP family intramembrane metalloprotease [Ktedonobacteraceae bacterium]|nr:CPBP family intramembrane metalloprotease [Ktedonobacteraceae bacterium]
MQSPIQTSSPLASTVAQPKAVDWTGVGLFLLFTFGISWTIWIGLRALDVPFLIRTSIGMFGPALAAVLTRLLRREGFADAGLRLRARGQRGAGWMYLAAYLVPPLLIAAGIGLVLLVGYQHWALSQHIHQLGIVLQHQLTQRHTTLPANTTINTLVQINLITSVALAFTFGIVFNMLFTFGEEFGWRGYLLPRLAPLGGLRAAILVGLIWGFWHAPLIILDGYNYPGQPWLGVLMMMLFTTLLSVIFAWLRFRSGSVWPSTLAHAAYNAQLGFPVLLLSTSNPLLGAPIGLLGLIPMFLFAIFLVITGRVKPGTLGPAAYSAGVE